MYTVKNNGTNLILTLKILKLLFVIKNKKSPREASERRFVEQLCVKRLIQEPPVGRSAETSGVLKLQHLLPLHLPHLQTPVRPVMRFTGN